MKNFIPGAAMAVALSLSVSVPAFADLRVFACEPEWGALSEEIGGDHVDIYTATTGGQDPHHIQARPSLISRARRADILICTGATLEIGWLPQVVRQAANRNIAEGQPGYFEATSVVTMLEVPSSVDRSQGDVHAPGNPHIQTNPHNIALVARALGQRFIELDPANASVYQARLADFLQRWDAALLRWEAEAAPLHGLPVVTQHQSWIYLEDWLGLDRVAVLESQPGVPPSSGHLAEVVSTLQDQPARMVIRAAYEDDRPTHFIAERLGIPAVELPFTVGGNDAADDLFGLYDETLRRLLAAAAQE
ncbi:metal ABC transporter substrate-binding protein [Maricaulis salignorans]|uniref:Zinc/manganese transport system substrate-binding protein n=1 Tax=Maricaulis salignorans TaxID=144026 RepID=A0A1G9M3H6_9PROT|nr:zinc ABC transporter substrate-binding protein [Maricaulis salignorans]SDL68673.1 zinc/manganese transport system substrate-binding protein [Maricaulis salignorans]